MIPRTRLLPVLALVLFTSVRAAEALDIQFDYTYDTGNFFLGHPDRQSLLESAAAVFESRLTDTLTAITPGGGNTWNATFFNPATGGQASLTDLTIGEGVVKIFVGARALPGDTLGFGGFGGFGGGGSQEWIDTLRARGQQGALAGTPTDFGSWGGAMTFDSEANWYFGTGSLAGKNDFYSVALHEMGHVFGLGTSLAWSSLSSNGVFQGSYSTAANGGTPVALDGTGHWADGTMSTIFGTNTPQEAAMSPAILEGTQKFFTTLDFAGMRDIGWAVVPEPSVVSLLAGAAAFGATFRRRGQRVMTKKSVDGVPTRS